MPPSAAQSDPLRLELAVIGLGSMGGAILRGILESSLLPSGRIGVCDPLEDRTSPFQDAGCKVLDPAEAGRSARVLLAIKPQMLPEVAAGIGPATDPRLAISVMAGIGSEGIAAALGDQTRIVRAMPNTPAAIGAGVTAIAPGRGASEEDLDFARMLFTAVGSTVDVDEARMHAVTAVSGSGPAWVYRQAEAWISAAIAEGLAADTAKILVTETLFGAARLLRESEDDAGTLREAVTSKGGTTAAGLAALDDNGFDSAVHAAVRAAARRGRELDALNDG